MSRPPLRASLAFALAATAAHSQTTTNTSRDLLIRYKDEVTAPERKAIETSLGITRKALVPSVEAEMWRLNPTQDVLSVLEKARNDSRFSLVDVGVADYRKLMVPLELSAPVDAATTQAVQQFMALPRNSGAKLFRLRATDFAERILEKGFGTKDALPRQQSLVLDLPGATSALLVRKPSPDGGVNGTVSWSGEVFAPGIPAADQKAKGTAQLTYRDGQVLGRVTYEGKTYRISPVADGVHAITPVDTNQLPPDHPAGSKPAVGTPPATSPSSTKDAGPPRVSVVIAVTPKVAERYTNLNHFEAELINQFNEISKNSLVAVRANSLGIKQFAFQDKDISADLAALKGAAAQQEIRDWRKAMKAHVAVLITTSNDACGEAAMINANSSTAYAVVSEECAVSNYSFTHEVGHLLGARHDEFVDPADDPFPHGHGYVFTNWRTVMAYKNACGSCDRLPYWSNPNVKYNGHPMGTIKRNHDARVILTTGSDMSEFTK